MTTQSNPFIQRVSWGSLALLFGYTRIHDGCAQPDDNDLVKISASNNSAIPKHFFSKPITADRKLYYVYNL